MDRADWERYYGWVPLADANGHALGPGLVSINRVMCPCPAAVNDGYTHPEIHCRVQGCKAPAIYPPGHIGEVPPQS